MIKKLTQLGSDTAKIGFYLPNPPNLPADWHESSKIDIEELITLNGNHWRKIFVIMAKILCPNNDWRDYLPQLLQQNESLHFGKSTFCPHAKIHLVCGQQSARALSLDILTEPQSFRLINQFNQQIYLLPYLDYRQCPNHTIESLRAALSAQ